MSSNTSIGRGHKGSKFWIQTLVNLDSGNALTKAIRKEDQTIGNIEWLSPIQDSYKEQKTDQIKGITKEQLAFWPANGPWWDGVGIDENGTILLVEAKGHVQETRSKCTAKDKDSIITIKTAMEYAHGELSSSQYNEDVWLNKYYQLANRLTFLVHLKKREVKVKLVLLNIVDDPTHISTSKEDWEKHYNDVFSAMTGSNQIPEDVILVNFKV